MRWILALCLLSVVTVFTAPAPVLAQDAACRCFCRSGVGAQDLENKESGEVCRSSCEAQGFALLGCYLPTQQQSYPENNKLCWTQNECESQSEDTATIVQVDSNIKVYEWGHQNNACVPGEGYCYKPQPDITLNVAIADLTTVSDLPTYINAVYSWLLPAASLLAVVMIMVGGLKYVLARGNTGKIGKATTQISNAVIGMVILMTAYAILNLIDPGLVTFKALRVPQIRTTLFLDENSTCEYMMGLGIDVSPGGGTCGVKGTIISLANLKPEVGDTTLQIGDSCIFKGCGSALQSCVSMPTDITGYACVSCRDSYNDAIGTPNPKAPAPSESTCSKLLYESPTPNPDTPLYCEYYQANPIINPIDYDATACTEIVYPADDQAISLNCERLRQDAQAAGSLSCRMYDNVWAVGGVAGLTFGRDGDDELDDKPGINDDYPLLTNICNADPCNLAPAGGACKVFSQYELLKGNPALAQSPFWQAGSVGDPDCVDTAAFSWLVSWWSVRAATSSGFMNPLEYPFITRAGGHAGVEADQVDYNPTW